MERSYLENMCMKNRTENSLRAIKNQNDFCRWLRKNEKKKNLNPLFVKDNKNSFGGYFSQVKETMVQIYNVF